MQRTALGAAADAARWADNEAWMEDWKEAIRNLVSAQAYFRAMGCSHLHMQREYPERYEEYRALGISEGTEAAWTRAEFDSRLGALTHGNDRAQELWAQHAYLADLAVRIRQLDSLRQLFTVTQQLVSLVPSSTRILVAETLVGRYRNGHDTDSLIQLAHALGDPRLGRNIADLVPSFCDSADAPVGGPPIRERKDRVLARLRVQSANLES